jgi:hypothetical protein
MDIGNQSFRDKYFIQFLYPEIRSGLQPLPQPPQLTEISFFIIPYFPLWRQVKMKVKTVVSRLERVYYSNISSFLSFNGKF